MANLFPSAVLGNSLHKPVSVELRDGSSFNGTLVSADRWMNLVLRGKVVRCSPDGESFTEVREVCIRGNSVRGVRVVDEALVPEERKTARSGLDKEERAKKYGRRDQR